MIPIKQTKFGKGQGNCLLACIASILERPLESIPDFCISGCGWFGELYEWCLNEDVGIICVNPYDLEHSLCFNTWCILIYSVKGIEDENHAVIGWCRRLEEPKIETEDSSLWKWEAVVKFDPNPNKVDIETLKHIVFLLPKLQTAWPPSRATCNCGRRGYE